MPEGKLWSPCIAGQTAQVNQSPSVKQKHWMLARGSGKMDNKNEHVSWTDAKIENIIRVIYHFSINSANKQVFTCLYNNADADYHICIYVHIHTCVCMCEYIRVKWGGYICICVCRGYVCVSIYVYVFTKNKYIFVPHHLIQLEVSWK